MLSVACRPEALWVLSHEGRVFIRVGLSASSLHGAAWASLELDQISDVHLTHLSLGSEVAWAVDTRYFVLK